MKVARAVDDYDGWDGPGPTGDYAAYVSGLTIAALTAERQRQDWRDEAGAEDAEALSMICQDEMQRRAFA